MEGLVALIMLVAVFFLVLNYSALSWGFVLYKLWGWFIIPLFPILPAINFVEAMGLFIFVSLFKGNPIHIKDEYLDQAKGWGYFILSPWITLLFAWLVKIVWM